MNSSCGIWKQRGFFFLDIQNGFRERYVKVGDHWEIFPFTVDFKIQKYLCIDLKIHKALYKSLYGFFYALKCVIMLSCSVYCWFQDIQNPMWAIDIAQGQSQFTRRPTFLQPHKQCSKETSNSLWFYLI